MYSQSQNLEKRTLGEKYEKLAENKLIEKGFVFIARNINYKFGEIDLIFESPNRDSLIFIEVRYRQKSSYLQPIETISTKKNQRLLRAVQAYLCKYRGPAKNIRLDLVAFQNEHEMKHYENFWGMM